MHRLSLPTLLLIGLALAGCAGRYKNTVKFNPSETLRVAVLPFAQVDSQGKFIKPDNSLAIDDVALISDQLQGTPAEYLQRLTENKISGTSLDLVPPALVAAHLSHNGFLKSNPREGYDYEKIFNVDKRVLCELLACDALLFGKVTKWDRTYLAIQSVSTVGLDLSLVSQQGEVLYSAQGTDSTGRGLLKGPTGFSDLVIEPIRGLSNDIITDLADRVVDEMLRPLYLANRPEYLESAPPAIFASAHDARDGSLSRKGRLAVLVYGTPGKSGYFSIGNAIENVPLIERNQGHYIGEYYPIVSDSFQNEPVYVYLTDTYGKTTKQRVGTSSVTIQ